MTLTLAGDVDHPHALKASARHGDDRYSDTAAVSDVADESQLAQIIHQAPAPAIGDQRAHAGAPGLLAAAAAQQQPGTQPSSWAIEQAPSAQPSWQQRMRSLLCCFAPLPGAPFAAASEPSTRRGATAPSVQMAPVMAAPAYQLPVPLPPTPPRVWTEAVIGPQLHEDRNKKTLVLDLDETLVHSSFKPIPNPDYILPGGWPPAPRTPTAPASMMAGMVSVSGCGRARAHAPAGARGARNARAPRQRSGRPSRPRRAAPLPRPPAVDIDGKLVDVYVLKRPWMDHFLSTIGPRWALACSPRAPARRYPQPPPHTVQQAGSLSTPHPARPPAHRPPTHRPPPQVRGGGVHRQPGQVRRPAARPA